MAIQSSKPQVNFSDKELAVYLMNKIDEFTETATAMPGYSDVKVKAVSVTGLQQPPEWASQADREMKVWVLNESVQINEDGNILQPGTTPYFWIGDICKKRIELFKPDRLTGEFPIADPRKRSIALPQLDGQVLVRLISAMKENYAGNVAGALLALSHYIMKLSLRSTRKCQRQSSTGRYSVASPCSQEQFCPQWASRRQTSSVQCPILEHLLSLRKPPWEWCWMILQTSSKFPRS